MGKKTDGKGKIIKTWILLPEGTVDHAGIPWHSEGCLRYKACPFRQQSTNSHRQAGLSIPSITHAPRAMKFFLLFPSLPPTTGGLTGKNKKNKIKPQTNFCIVFILLERKPLDKQFINKSIYFQTWICMLYSHLSIIQWICFCTTGEN